MLKALRFFGWPLLAGVLIAMLIIQRYPELVGLPSLDVNLQQAPQTSAVVQGPVTYADAVTIAAPAVVNLYTTKVINKPAHPLFEDPQFRRYFGEAGDLEGPSQGGEDPLDLLRRQDVGRSASEMDMFDPRI